MTPKAKPLPFDTEEAGQIGALIRFHAEALRNLVERATGEPARSGIHLDVGLVYVRLN